MFLLNASTPNTICKTIFIKIYNNVLKYIYKLKVIIFQYHISHWLFFKPYEKISLSKNNLKKQYKDSVIQKTSKCSQEKNNIIQVTLISIRINLHYLQNKNSTIVQVLNILSILQLMINIYYNKQIWNFTNIFMY